MSEAGRFSIKTPVLLAYNASTVDTLFGKLELNMFLGQRGGEALFAVAYSDYPEGLVRQSDIDLMLDGVRLGAIQNVNGTLLSEEHITLSGYPGREFIAKVQFAPGVDGVLRARYYLVEFRLYQIFVVVRPDHETDQDVEDFLDSFKLLRD